MSNERKDNSLGEEECQRKNTDTYDLLSAVGNFGRFQRIVTTMFCIMVLFPICHVVITYFIADTPSWRCATNSSSCYGSGIFSNKDQRRCEISRSEWHYTKPQKYSIVTQWNLDCDRKWLSDLVTSMLFIGWIIGAPILGWIADNVGRRVVLIHSMNVILVTTFVSAFAPNVYSLLACRFITGFFMNGTFPQMILIITGIVGPKQQTCTSLVVFTFIMVGLANIGIKAYFIREWKILYIVCSVPYVITIMFYRFIPESLTFLHAKGKNEEIKILFQRIAIWNKKVCPPNITTNRLDNQKSHKSSPLDLFKTNNLTIATLIPAVISFANIVVYYGLYFEAGDLGGSMYRDYIIITAPEVLFNFLNVYLSERFGLRRMTLSFTLLSTCACIGLIFTVGNEELKIVNILFGMIGKCCCGVAFCCLTSWATTLIPPHLSSEAMGIAISFSRLGGIAAPWMINYFTKIYKRLPFIAMTFMGFLSCFLIVLLWKFGKPINTSQENGGDIESDENTVTSHTNVEVDLDV